MVERQPSRPPIPEPQHTPHEGGNGAPGTPPNLNERAKPPPESPERKPRPRLVYSPKKETFEEYKKRFDETWAQRKIEDAQRRQEEPDEQKEKRRKYNSEYKRRWRKTRKEQREAALTQRDQEHHEAI
jgi:hypothetical protein